MAGSPKRTPGAGNAVTSPVRRSSRITRSGGGGGGGGIGGVMFDSPTLGTGGAGGAGVMMDFASLFGGDEGGPRSPSPRNRGGNRNSESLPSYLLTASPGTALNRILRDTSLDLGELGESASGGFGTGRMFESSTSTSLEIVREENHDPLGFFTGTGMEEDDDDEDDEGKENDDPQSLPPTTDFDTILSSLRRDFNTRLSSSNPDPVTTSPSSPPPPESSSPCVQPRSAFSSGQKSSRVPPYPSPFRQPSMFNTFMTAGEDTPGSDSDAWTPGDGGFGDPPSEMFRNLTGRSGFVNHHQQSHRSQLSGSGSGHNRNPFDTSSLPPSSPPQIPSEAFPTPSEGDGFTPLDNNNNSSNTEDESTEIDHVEMLARSAGASTQDAVEALLVSLGGGATGAGGGKVELDRSMVAQLLQMISSNHSGGAESTSGKPSPALDVDSTGSMPVAGSSVAGSREGEDEATKELYTSFAEARGD